MVLHKKDRGRHAKRLDGRYQEPQLHRGCRCTRHRADAAGRRVLSYLPLAATLEGREVTMIEGLVEGDQLHPVQAAFIKYDGSQCGYCTPGQIGSAEWTPWRSVP
jgi:aerobic-type carbon monoxide dehydrogenase small subunit (CoxS/CutS family)